MNESMKEILSLAESEANWLDQAARYFEEFAAMLKAQEKAEWDLLATCYSERAQMIQRTVEKVRKDFATDGASELQSGNS
jgi:hypothetical protein